MSTRTPLSGASGILEEQSESVAGRGVAPRVAKLCQRRFDDALQDAEREGREREARTRTDCREAERRSGIAGATLGRRRDLERGCAAVELRRAPAVQGSPSERGGPAD